MQLTVCLCCARPTPSPQMSKRQNTRKGADAPAPAAAPAATATHFDVDDDALLDGGVVEVAEFTAPDGRVLHVRYRGVPEGVTPGTAAYKRERRLADNRASAARSRALARLRSMEMETKLASLLAENARLQEENARLQSAVTTGTSSSTGTGQRSRTAGSSESGEEYDSAMETASMPSRPSTPAYDSCTSASASPSPVPSRAAPAPASAPAAAPRFELPDLYTAAAAPHTHAAVEAVASSASFTLPLLSAESGWGLFDDLDLSCGLEGVDNLDVPAAPLAMPAQQLQQLQQLPSPTGVAMPELAGRKRAATETAPLSPTGSTTGSAFSAKRARRGSASSSTADAASAGFLGRWPATAAMMLGLAVCLAVGAVLPDVSDHHSDSAPTKSSYFERTGVPPFFTNSGRYVHLDLDGDGEVDDNDAEGTEDEHERKRCGGVGNAAASAAASMLYRARASLAAGKVVMPPAAPATAALTGAAAVRPTATASAATGMPAVPVAVRNQIVAADMPVAAPLTLSRPAPAAPAAAVRTPVAAAVAMADEEEDAATVTSTVSLSFPSGSDDVDPFEVSSTQMSTYGGDVCGPAPPVARTGKGKGKGKGKGAGAVGAAGPTAWLQQASSIASALLASSSAAKSLNPFLSSWSSPAAVTALMAQLHSADAGVQAQMQDLGTRALEMMQKVLPGFDSGTSVEAGSFGVGMLSPSQLLEVVSPLTATTQQKQAPAPAPAVPQMHSRHSHSIGSGMDALMLEEDFTSLDVAASSSSWFADSAPAAFDFASSPSLSRGAHEGHAPALPLPLW